MTLWSPSSSPKRSRSQSKRQPVVATDNDEGVCSDHHRNHHHHHHRDDLEDDAATIWLEEMACQRHNGQSVRFGYEIQPRAHGSMMMINIIIIIIIIIITIS
ncbi:hypothetical protein ACLKA6_001870 [Drosophila palustris]